MNPLDMSLGIETAITATRGCTNGGEGAVAFALAQLLHRAYGDRASTVAGDLLRRVMEIDRDATLRAALSERPVQ